MSTFAWRNARLQQTSYTVQCGEYQLGLRRCHANTGATPEAPPILMVAGFNHGSEVFWPQQAEAGLAPYLADQGFDVFVAELRGKGASWPEVSRHSKWGLHELITQDIPAHLRKIAKLRPGAPQFWIGHGLGSLLLSACYSRLDLLPAPVLGFVHFAPQRRCEFSSMLKTLRYMQWQGGLGLCSLLYGRSGLPGKPVESRDVSHQWQQWLTQPQWLDSTDNTDYVRLLRARGLPPSLYFAVQGNALWGGVDDARLWMKELGRHDARLIGLGKAVGNLRNYNATSMLTHVDACEDHFVQLHHWLTEQKQAFEGHYSRRA
jgi:pimeloyl-ACP methyl ester carboxylesterase